jgi:hypothetical protein
MNMRIWQGGLGNWRLAGGVNTRGRERYKSFVSRIGFGLGKGIGVTLCIVDRLLRCSIRDNKGGLFLSFLRRINGSVSSQDFTL